MRLALSLSVICLLAVCLAAPATAARSVLVVGDSLSIPLGKQLEHYYALQPAVAFHSQGKVSSGLVRPDFYNWPEVLGVLAAKRQPDVLLVMLGTNDVKAISANGKRLDFGGEAWNQEYARRVQQLLDIARSHNPEVVIHWVGAPAMADPELDAGVRHVNAVIKKQVERVPNCHFIDSRLSLADQAGRYMQHARTPEGKVTLRADDGIHLTTAGAALLADCCLGSMDMNTNSQQTVLAQAPPSQLLPQQKAEQGQAQSRLPERAVSLQQAAASVPAYALQESSWSHVAKARSRAGELSSQGIPAWIKTVDLGGKGVWHRVMIGSFNSLERARQRKLDLSRRHALSHTLIVKTG